MQSYYSKRVVVVCICAFGRESVAMADGYPVALQKKAMRVLALTTRLLELKVCPCRYGYSQQVKQDEVFMDMVLQQISVLLFTELRDFIFASPELKQIVDQLPSPPPGMPLL